MDPNAPKTYTYTVTWQDAKGRDHEARYNHKGKYKAIDHYNSLPWDNPKALWQTWRKPEYGNQLMRIHNPKQGMTWSKAARA